MTEKKRESRANKIRSRDKKGGKYVLRSEQGKSQPRMWQEWGAVGMAHSWLSQGIRESIKLRHGTENLKMVI